MNENKYGSFNTPLYKIYESDYKIYIQFFNIKTSIYAVSCDKWYLVQSVSLFFYETPMQLMVFGSEGFVIFLLESHVINGVLFKGFIVTACSDVILFKGFCFCMVGILFRGF